MTAAQLPTTDPQPFCPSGDRVRGKVVVVTGAASGIGAATVVALAGQSATVLATDRAAVPNDADLLAAITAGAPITYHTLDVTDPVGWRAIATTLSDAHGRVDGLVNCAGMTWRARLATIKVDDANLVHAVNVIGPMLGIQVLAPLMPTGGSIVNVGSIAALTAHYPVAYTTSKWALRGLSQVAALELGALRIRVNVVHPGYIETPMTSTAPTAFHDSNISMTPLGRTGTPQEVAALIVFLISDESSYISGAEIPIDGGMSGHGGAKNIVDAMFPGQP